MIDELSIWVEVQIAVLHVDVGLLFVVMLQLLMHCFY